MSEARIIATIERITYHNEDNGYFVIKCMQEKVKDLITIVGHSPNIIIGETIEVVGIWIHNKDYGLQLQAKDIKFYTPNSLEGIKKYLGSGLIKGVGKHYANLLVSNFKNNIFNILDNEPFKLKEISGIGNKKANQIIESWQNQKKIREVMIFLHTHGIGTMRAAKIYKTYGDDTINKLKENPYSLADDIFGIGFKTADKLAMNLGIDRNSIIRAQAGIKHIIAEHSNSGHCYITPTDLLTQSTTILAINEDIINQAISIEINNNNIIKEVINTDTYIYLSPLYYAEVGVANNIHKLLISKNDKLTLTDDEILDIAQKNTNIILSSSQIDAVLMAIKSKVSIITGGPGVGKTTIIRNIIKILKHLNTKITLCAPTGRAAKRLSMASKMGAYTIHRLLEFKLGSKPKYNQNYPLQTDYLIIDETSMVDIILMNALIRAIPEHASILFVGDVDQLPSVGPGSVLNDLIYSDILPVMRLTEIFRQAKTSKIITNSHRINEGKMPYYENKKDDDFFFIELNNSDEILERITSIVIDKLPKIYNIDPFLDIQILSPMNRGILGVKNLNILLQNALNKNSSSSIDAMGINFRVNDKVIQKVNNYEKEVFNGDIGFIQNIDIENNEIFIQFDNNIVKYEKSDLDEIELAYAISIHKSQGSEFPIVIIPIATSHYPMLERNLIYTAITRGKKMVILVGEKKALYIAINKLNVNKRLTNLQIKLSNKL